MKNKLCGAFLLAVAVLHCVLGDYELEVRLHKYNNPTSRCGGCGSDPINGNLRMRCCDHNDPVEVCVGGDRCDNYFISCFKGIGSDGPCITDRLALTSPSFDNTDSVNFTTIGLIYSSVISDDIASSAVNSTIKFNVGSSILLLQRTGAWEGVQLFIDVMDMDNGTMLVFQPVDNFTIDLNTSFLIPGTGFTARTVYNGTFNLGRLDLSFQVSCAANFFGSHCATECIPPNNRTTCDEDGTRVCLPGFTGANCMINIDDCSYIDACGSNGQCVDGINAFTCQCDNGFTGANCTTDIDDCEGVDCGNGTCRDTGAVSFVCQCDPGFTGEQCSAEIDECQGINCSGNGQCIAELASISCNCNVGFTGERCETKIDKCLGIDCDGNGQCINELASISCNCNAGFTGERCETDIDDCASANCSENSRCVDGVNSFSCVCRTGFSGDLCEPQVGTNIPENPFVVIWVSLGATLGFTALVLILLALCLLVVVRRVQRKRRVVGSYDVSTKEDTIAGDSGSCDSTLRYQPPQSVSNKDPSNGAAAEHSFRNPIYGPPLDAGDYECNPIV